MTDPESAPATAPVLDPTTENLRTAAECIREGGVVVAPSDTNLALTLDPFDAAAVERAYAIKDRPAHKPLTLFVRDPADWRRYTDHPDPRVVEALAEAFWPAPLNLVLPAGQALADADDRLTREGTVSVGCLSNPTCREIAGYVDGPLAMTSANRSGTVADDQLVDVALAREHVGEGVDYIVAGEAQGTTRASTIVDLTDASADGEGIDPAILRAGDVTGEEIRATLDSR